MTIPTPSRTVALAVLLNVVLFAVSLQAQDAHTPHEQPGLAKYDASELELLHFEPRHTHPAELAKMARKLFGRSFFVSDGGAAHGAPVENIQMIGDRLLIFDEAARLKSMLSRLHTLDAVSEGTDATANHEVYETQTWSPGHVSLRDAQSALNSYRRALPYAASVGNITTVDERNMMILRDTKENLAEMRAVLEQLDHPAPELMVSAMIVQGRTSAPGADAPPLPAELTDNLKLLVPYEHFELLSLGFVRTSTRVGNVEIAMPADDERYYQFGLRPDSYDAQAGALTAQLRFSGNDRREIQTRTQIPVNEYTVVGASGRDPLFLVIKLTPVGGDAH